MSVHTNADNDTFPQPIHRASRYDRGIEKLLGLSLGIHSSHHEPTILIPDNFKDEMIFRRSTGEIKQTFATYYLAILTRGDSP